MILRTPIALAASLIAAAASSQTIPQPDPLLAPPALGSWSYAPVQGGSEAVYSDPTGKAQLTLRCTRATRQISIIRPAAAASSVLQLWTSSGLRQLAAAYDAANGRVRADVAITDTVLDELAFSRGKFAVGALGYTPLVVPNWPEPTRAIEDCRN